MPFIHSLPRRASATHRAAKVIFDLKKYSRFNYWE
jgi:hypothetical protein